MGIKLVRYFFHKLFDALIGRKRIHPTVAKGYVIKMIAADIQTRANREGTFSIRLGEKDVAIRVQPTPVFEGESIEAIKLSEDGKEHIVIDTVSTYSGEVVGVSEDSSDVRLTITDETVFGYVRDEQDWWFIDPMRKFQEDASTEEYLVYRTRDLQYRMNFREPIPVETKHSEDGLSHRVNPIIGIVPWCDREYYYSANIVGLHWWQAQAGAINMVNGIYKKELGIEFKVRYFVFDTSKTSLSSSLDTKLISQLYKSSLDFGDITKVTYRNKNKIEVIHLFTGKSLIQPNGSSSLGITHRPGVLGLSHQKLFRVSGNSIFGRPNLGYQLLITLAHELGHSFDAFHKEADIWCVAHFLWCWDWVRSIMWESHTPDAQPVFSRGARNSSRNNAKRIKDNAASGRNVNFRPPPSP